MTSSTSTIAQRLGQAIKRTRKAAGMAQDELAARAGVSRPSIARWELGTSTPTVTNLAALADALGVAAADFLDERSRPRLTGWPQVVDFQGTPMRIVMAEFGSVDSTLCLTCGTHEHRKTITLRLVDEASFQEAHRV